jgi:hypothetical protein
MAPLSVHQYLWQYIEGDGKSKYCMIPNFSHMISLALSEGGGISEFECSLTQEFINTMNLRTLEVETFNILKLFRHQKRNMDVTLQLLQNEFTKHHRQFPRGSTLNISGFPLRLNWAHYVTDEREGLRITETLPLT